MLVFSGDEGIVGNQGRHMVDITYGLSAMVKIDDLHRRRAHS